jgi:hypothetical protein
VSFVPNARLLVISKTVKQEATNFPLLYSVRNSTGDPYPGDRGIIFVRNNGMVELQPYGCNSVSPRHFAWQRSAWVSQNLRPSYLSHVIALVTKADAYWHVHLSGCRNTLPYAHSSHLWPVTSAYARLTLPASAAGGLCRITQSIQIYLTTQCHVP